MLVLSRRVNDKVILPSLNVSVHVVAIKAGVVRLGFEAPPEVPILRHEVQERARQWTEPPAVPAAPSPEQEMVRTSSVGLGLALIQLQAGQFAEAALTLEQLKLACEGVLRTAKEGVASASAEKEGVPRAPAEPPAVRRALLVEDDPGDRELLARLLRRSGVEVDVVGDGVDALEYLHTHQRPDVVLMDMGLPRCDGPTAVREIRRDPCYAGLPIFAVSGRLREEFDLAEGSSGVNRWFHKPLDPAELIRDVGLLPTTGLSGV